MMTGLDYRPATGYPNSGIGRQNLALEYALRANPSTRVQLFTVAPQDHPIRRLAYCPSWSTPLHGLHRLPERLRFEGLFLPKALRDAEVQVYICNMNMGLPLGRKPAGLRYILQLQDLFQLTLKNSHGSRLKAAIYGVTDRLSIGHSVRVADRIWTPSQFTADECARLFPESRDKLRVLPALVSGWSDAPADLQGWNLPQRYWLCVGTREPRKNMPWFVDAWQNARRQFANIPDLILIGAPEHLPAAQQGLAGLHFLSDISDAELHALYRGANRFWHPSYAEGFGLPVVEAMSVGTPVAIATGSSLDEITPPGSPRFSPTDSQALITLMGELASAEPQDPETLKQWAAGFGPSAFQQRFDELIEELN
ncbi:glycosyltransferase family 4 protein [Pseudomonas syringae]|uniref:Glycosyl transferase family 1 n=1 Tax=Pseudomonas syringae TaxID=317 RepID=A0A085VDS8_PSESX|nr:glycosyltransferase family 1 protein [Pseudomonas syringae]KFE53591.1 glycosyl transferase family 1 [Pseudomonas syringae]